LQAPGRGQIHLSGFGNDTSRLSGGQNFFKSPEHITPLTGLDHDQHFLQTAVEGGWIEVIGIMNMRRTDPENRPRYSHHDQPGQPQGKAARGTISRTVSRAALNLVK